MEPDLAQLAALLPDGLVVVDGEGRILLANAAALSACDVTEDQLVGRPLAEGLPLQTPDGSLWWDGVDPFEAAATSAGHREVLLMLPHGRQVLLTARYERPAAGGPAERLLLGLRSAESRQRAEVDHAALIWTVAHELRGPLASITGFSTSLLRRWERFTDPQRRFMVETVQEDAERLSRLISELLDVSRLDAGRMELHRRPVDLPAVFQRHVDSAVASGTPAERFRVEVHPGLQPVWADPDRLDQILGNLVQNALVHGRGRVTLGAAPLGEPSTPAAVHRDGSPCHGTRLWVADEGDGIAAEHRPIAFTRFWQAHRDRGSAGLGLYVVHGLVEAHNGRITIGDAPGGGALFEIRLACARPEGEAARVQR